MVVLTYAILADVRVAFFSKKSNVLGKEAVHDRPAPLAAFVHVVA